MAKQVNTIVADNGKEFDTIEEAQKYEAFLAAKEQFEIACNQWNRALAVQFVTGDGHPFSFERSTYYYVREHANGSRCSEETLYNRECRVSDEGTVTRSRYDANGERVMEFEISQLFISQKAALTKLLEIKEKEYGWAADDLEELKVRIAKAY